jgi:hypothetical protein
MRPYCFVFGALLWCTVSFAQTGLTSTHIPPTGFVKWDDTTNAVVVYRDQHSRSDIPLEVYDPLTSTKRSLSILRDFPQASQAFISNVAIGTSGTIVVVCRLEYPDSTLLKDLILSYGPSLTLEKVWDVAPYEPNAIAVDEQGNVYSLGTRYDEPASGMSYPILVVYDSQGRTKKEMLSRSMFPAITDPVTDNQKMGFVTIRVTDTRIFVYLPSVHDMLTLDRNGKLLKQVDVREVYQRLAREKGYTKFVVREDCFSSVGELWSGLILRTPSDPYSKYSSLIVQLTEAGQAVVQHEEKDQFSVRLAGVTSSNEPVTLDIDASRWGTLRIGSR